MGKKKKGDAVHGWVVLDKPSGITSTQAVATVRRIFNAQKAGHAGTLDPLATGILAIALGEATKTVPYVQDAAKIYRFTATWGESRDSDDAEGEVTGTSDARPTKAAIEAMLPRFTGTLTQIPPAYSAIKVAGERAYDLARQGEEVALEPRQVQVHEARLVEIEVRFPIGVEGLPPRLERSVAVGLRMFRPRAPATPGPYGPHGIFQQVPVLLEHRMAHDILPSSRDGDSTWVQPEDLTTDARRRREMPDIKDRNVAFAAPSG